jgi:hypothetical protein
MPLPEKSSQHFAILFLDILLWQLQGSWSIYDTCLIWIFVIFLCSLKVSHFDSAEERCGDDVKMAFRNSK